jgi:hypothetical protein
MVSDAWLQQGFSAEGWTSVHVGVLDIGTLVPYIGPPIRRQEEDGFPRSPVKPAVGPDRPGCKVTAVEALRAALPRRPERMGHGVHLELAALIQRRAASTAWVGPPHTFAG